MMEVRYDEIESWITVLTRIIIFYYKVFNKNILWKKPLYKKLIISGNSIILF